MTSSLKITVFFVLAVTISCYGQTTPATNATNVEVDACVNATTCNECLNLSNCVFRPKNCSASPGNVSNADDVCVHATLFNATASPVSADNCTIKELDQCKSINDTGMTTATTTESDGLPMMPTQEDMAVTESSASSSEVTSAATPTAAGSPVWFGSDTTAGDIGETTTAVPAVTTETGTTGAPNGTGPAEVSTTVPSEVTTPTGTTEGPTTTVPSTTAKDNSSTSPEHNSSTDGHPSTSDHTDPAKPSPRHFDAPSFVGGIILSIGLLAIAFVGYKFYRARTEHNYHTL